MRHRQDRDTDRSMLRALEGTALDQRRGRATPRMAWLPTVVRIEDERGDIEDIVDAAMDGVGSRSPSRLMQRQAAARAGFDVTDSGAPTFEGRRCCVAAIEQVERQLHKLRLPHEFSCRCGARYQVVGELR